MGVTTRVTTNDNSIKFGWRYGGSQGHTVLGSSTQYTNRMGGNFCKTNGGIITMGVKTQTTTSGWVVAPKETTHG